MILFHCQGCGHKYEVPDKYAGKKVRCKECNEIFIVPIRNEDKHQMMQLEHRKPITNKSAEQAFENNHYHQQSYSASTIPIWIWCLFGVLGVSFISFVLYMLVFRDTWEIDHYREISQMISEAKSFVDDKDFESGAVKYSELNNLVGNRELKDKNLKQEVATALNNYETLKKIIHKEKKRQAEQALLEKQRRKDAEEKRRMAEAERQRKIEEEEKMSNPPVVDISNCKTFFRAAKNNDVFQFILFRNGYGTANRTFNSGSNVYLRFFENTRTWVNNRSGATWDDYRVDSDFHKYITSLPDQENQFWGVVCLYSTPSSSYFEQMKKNDVAFMLLKLPISKQQLLDLSFTDKGKRVIIRCKIDNTSIMTKEVKERIKPYNIAVPTGGRYFEATAYYMEPIEFEHPLSQSIWAQLEVLKEKSKVAQSAYFQKINQNAQRAKNARRATRPTTPTSTKKHCSLCGGSGVAMICSDTGLRDNYKSNGVPEYGPCPRCSR